MHAQPQHQLLSTQLQLSAASYQARTLRHTAQRGSALLDLQHLTLTTHPAEPVLLSTSTCLRTTRCAVGCWKGKLAQRGGDEAQQGTTSCTGSKGPEPVTGASRCQTSGPGRKIQQQSSYAAGGSGCQLSVEKAISAGRCRLRGQS